MKVKVKLLSCVRLLAVQILYFVFCMFLTYLRNPFRFKEPTVAAEGGSLNSIIKGLTDVVDGQGWGRYGGGGDKHNQEEMQNCHLSVSIHVRCESWTIKKAEH